MSPLAPVSRERLIDRFGRVVNYVRISVTDRCDFRCVYCMEPDTRFVPRAQVLTLEEIELIARAFVEDPDVSGSPNMSCLFDSRRPGAVRQARHR